MPAGTPPHKTAGEDPGPEHRLAMCEALVRAADRLSASPLEMERAGPSYTVDTLRSIRASHPEAELTFIVGADTAANLATWREPREIIAVARLAIASREGAGRREVLATLHELGGAQHQTEFLNMPRVAVSSSLIRDRVAAGEPVQVLTGPGVARYIGEHRLYGAVA
jgi:nicotinate-nucleotide adenylyltransferase